MRIADTDTRRLLLACQRVGLFPPHRDAHVLVGGAGGDATARRPVEKTYLYQVRLDDLLYGLALLTDRGRDSADPDRPAVKLLYDDAQKLAINLVKTEAVNLHLV